MINFLKYNLNMFKIRVLLLLFLLVLIHPQDTPLTIPTAAFGGQNVNLYGVHGISNIGDGLRSMGDITKLLLGNDLCSRFDVVQAAISGTSN